MTPLHQLQCVNSPTVSLYRELCHWKAELKEKQVTGQGGKDKICTSLASKISASSCQKATDVQNLCPMQWEKNNVCY